jgi:hypothetical protein
VNGATANCKISCCVLRTSYLHEPRREPVPREDATTRAGEHPSGTAARPTMSTDWVAVVMLHHVPPAGAVCVSFLDLVPASVVLSLPPREPGVPSPSAIPSFLASSCKIPSLCQSDSTSVRKRGKSEPNSFREVRKEGKERKREKKLLSESLPAPPAAQAHGISFAILARRASPAPLCTSHRKMHWNAVRYTPGQVRSGLSGQAPAHEQKIMKMENGKSSP